MSNDRFIVYRDPAALVGYGRNTRTHTDAQVRAIRRSIDEFGFNNPVLLKDDERTVGAGHARLAASLLPPALERVPTITLTGLDPARWRAYVIADNRLAESGSGWDFETLQLELADLQFELPALDLTITGFEPDFGSFPLSASQVGAGRLSERFGVPPFSVLNAREGWWQDRKRAWIALGIQSELGRGDGGESTLGAVAPNERQLLARDGAYA